MSKLKFSLCNRRFLVWIWCQLYFICMLIDKLTILFKIFFCYLWNFIEISKPSIRKTIRLSYKPVFIIIFNKNCVRFIKNNPKNLTRNNYRVMYFYRSKLFYRSCLIIMLLKILLNTELILFILIKYNFLYKKDADYWFSVRNLCRLST